MNGRKPVAISEPGGSDPTRGSGTDKVTQAAPPDLEAPPLASQTEAQDSNMPDPARGGCGRFGWGCLPMLVIMAMPVTGLFF